MIDDITSPTAPKVVGSSAQTGSAWTPEKGWRGLVPGKSTLKNVFALLGQPDSLSSQPAAELYNFCQDKVRITFKHGDTRMCRMWISADYPDADHVPATIYDAEKIYGKLEAKGLNKDSGLVYQRTGLKLVCKPNSQPLQVMSLEFEPIGGCTINDA